MTLTHRASKRRCSLFRCAVLSTLLSSDVLSLLCETISLWYMHIRSYELKLNYFCIKNDFSSNFTVCFFTARSSVVSLRCSSGRNGDTSIRPTPSTVSADPSDAETEVPFPTTYSEWGQGRTMISRFQAPFLTRVCGHCLALKRNYFLSPSFRERDS